MGLTILKKKTGYALGLLLIVVGILMLLVVLWELYQAEDFVTELLEGEIEVFRIRTGLKPIYSTLLGVVLLVVGAAILVVRREKIRVVEEVKVLLECPFCKSQWREAMSKPHLESMGYPKVRTLSRRKCPKCAKFIRPKIVATEG